MTAFSKSDWASARGEQLRSVRLVQILSGHGYMGAAKAVMRMLGVDVGPARLPNISLSAAQAATLQQELELLGFFDWISPTRNAVTK